MPKRLTSREEGDELRTNSVESSPDPTIAQYPGDPRHLDHSEFLLELGHATYAASRLAGIAFDILRVHKDALSADLYNDPLGRLEKKLREFPPDGLPGLEEFMTQLASARTSRNDLLHALPVQNGLHRRRKEDPDSSATSSQSRISATCARELLNAHRKGSEVLYSDGGAAIKKWYENSEGTIAQMTPFEP